MRISNLVWMRHVDFDPGNPNDTRPQLSTRLRIERSSEIFASNCMSRFKGHVLKSTSLHKTKGCVTSIKLKNAGLRF